MYPALDRRGVRVTLFGRIGMSSFNEEECFVCAGSLFNSFIFYHSFPAVGMALSLCAAVSAGLLETISMEHWNDG